jgi:hypothetical protein
MYSIWGKSSPGRRHTSAKSLKNKYQILKLSMSLLQEKVFIFLLSWDNMTLYKNTCLYKVKFKHIKDFTVRPQAVKLLEENTSKYRHRQ